MTSQQLTALPRQPPLSRRRTPSSAPPSPRTSFPGPKAPPRATARMRAATAWTRAKRALPPPTRGDGPLLDTIEWGAHVAPLCLQMARGLIGDSKWGILRHFLCGQAKGFLKEGRRCHISNFPYIIFFFFFEGLYFQENLKKLSNWLLVAVVFQSCHINKKNCLHIIIWQLTARCVPKLPYLGSRCGNVCLLNFFCWCAVNVALFC